MKEERTKTRGIKSTVAAGLWADSGICCDGFWVRSDPWADGTADKIQASETASARRFKPSRLLDSNCWVRNLWFTISMSTELKLLGNSSSCCTCNLGGEH